MILTYFNIFQPSNHPKNPWLKFQVAQVEALGIDQAPAPPRRPAKESASTWPMGILVLDGEQYIDIYISMYSYILIHIYIYIYSHIYIELYSYRL